MRAFVITGPHRCEVRTVDPPVAQPGQAVVDVARVGLCGTDVEFFTGEMAYLHQGHESYPLRPGHEWCGTVSAVGAGVDRSWVGRRVTGDTMLGCGDCDRCRHRRQHLCAERYEVGVRGGFPGALADQLAVPASSLHALPDAVDDVAGAMVEPGGNALRAARAAGLEPGDRALSSDQARSVCWPPSSARPRRRGAPRRSNRRVDRLRPPPRFRARRTTRRAHRRPLRCGHRRLQRGDRAGRGSRSCRAGQARSVYIGIAGAPSLIDTRELVLKDLTTVGILSGSAGLPGAIEAYAAGAVDPRPLVAATVGLAEVSDVLTGWRPTDAGPGPKMHVDPRR